MKLFRDINRLFIDKLYNYTVLKKFGVKFGNDIYIAGRIALKGEKNCIEIGDGVRINSSSSSNPIGFENRTSLWCIGCGKITVGNFTGISNASIVSMNGSINIGNNVFLGGGVKIYNTDFHSIEFEKRVIEHDIDKPCGNVIINDGAFIGAGTMILKNVIIGKHSVIGACSVVTNNVPDNEVWAGNPAKFIKKVLS